MNKVFISIIAFVCLGALPALAQKKDSLSFDERDKYIYYQVEDQPEANTDTLYNRAINFLKNGFDNDKLKLDKQNADKGMLTGKGSFMVSRKALVSRQDDAKIVFNMVIEVKDGKYRYWFTDFAAIPYQRDRYADYSPKDGKKIPMEHGLRKLGATTLDSYLEQILKNCRNMSGVLRAYMQKPSGVVKETVVKKSVTKKEW